jgi:D-ribose pyranose/furanose isomerase RbsD
MKDLKAKHVSGDNYLKILKLKKELSKLVSEHGEQEKSVIEDLGLPHDETKWNFDERSTALEKLKPIHESLEYELVERNFLSIEEFKEWTKEQDTAIVAILAEHLLKDF